MTLWKIITNKRTADCKQLAPLSGLSLVISLNPRRGQGHRDGGEVAVGRGVSSVVCVEGGNEEEGERLDR